MSTPTNDGGPAFPLQDWDPCIHARRFETGMSLRDYLAAHALVGCLSNHKLLMIVDKKFTESTRVAAANYAYALADAMLRAREKGCVDEN